MPWPDDVVVEVDEDVAAEQDVDLVLARRVALHQPLEGARLVAAVVVDVHPRVALAALQHEVDERLEHPLLLAPGHAPTAAWNTGSPSGAALGPAEQVLEAVVERPRVRLDVEEHVEPRGRRQRREALAGLVRVGRDQLVAGPGPPRARGAGGWPGGAAGRGSAGRTSRTARSSGSAASPASVVTPAPTSARRCVARRARDERQVVVGAPPVHAVDPPRADAAVVDGLGVGRRCRRPAPSRTPAPRTAASPTGSRRRSRRAGGDAPAGRRSRPRSSRAGCPGGGRAGPRRRTSGGSRRP